MFSSLYTKLELVEKKRMRFFLALTLALVVVITSVLCYWYYREVESSSIVLEELNNYRDDVRVILDKAQRLEQQRKEANKLLSEEEDFKIGGYAERVLAKLNLTNKKTSSTVSTTEREDNYLENIMNIRFDGLNMKELTELLYEFEQKPRIYTRNIEISKTKKGEVALSVSITIATLLAKPTAAS